MLHTLTEALSMYGPRLAIQRRLLLLMPAAKGDRSRVHVRLHRALNRLASVPRSQCATPARASVQASVGVIAAAASTAAKSLPLRTRHLFARCTLSETARLAKYPLTFQLPARVTPRCSTALVIDWQRRAARGGEVGQRECQICGLVSNMRTGTVGLTNS